MHILRWNINELNIQIKSLYKRRVNSKNAEENKMDKSTH